MPKQIAAEDILNATMRLFVERGYAGATMRQIAEAASVNEVTLFRKFGSKAELVTAAVAHEVGRIAETELNYSGDVTADLTRIVTRYQEAVTHYGAFLPVLLAEIPRYPELQPTLKVPFRVIKLIADLLARYQEEGVLRTEPPLHAVGNLLGPVMVLAMIRAAAPDLDVPAPDPSTHVTAFLRGRLVVGSAG